MLEMFLWETLFFAVNILSEKMGCYKSQSQKMSSPLKKLTGFIHESAGSMLQEYSYPCEGASCGKKIVFLKIHVGIF